MAKSRRQLQGMAYVPGVARGRLSRDTRQAAVVALTDPSEAIDPAARPAAFIVVEGAPLSHRMIALAARRIPTVLITARQAQRLQTGVEVRVDGASGLVEVDAPESGTELGAPEAPETGQPVRLADGTPVWLLASVRGVPGARLALTDGAAGIGLVRSEFLGSEETEPPGVEFFSRELEALCQSAGSLNVTVRLLDLAPDKPPRWLPNADRLLRPLGMQGARLYRRDPVRGVVEHQLTALGALQARFDLEILIPYLGRYEEMQHWSAYVRRLLPPGVRVGAMVETPAALLDLANWCQNADFLAVGCNDLMQCLFGADRDEPALRAVLDPYAPVLYRLLGEAAAAAGDHLDRIRLCGVLPRLAGVLPVLVGIGYRRFSVDSVWIPYLARGLRGLSLTEAQSMARAVSDSTTSRQVCERLGLAPDADPLGSLV